MVKKLYAFFYLFDLPIVYIDLVTVSWTFQPQSGGRFSTPRPPVLHQVDSATFRAPGPSPSATANASSVFSAGAMALTEQQIKIIQEFKLQMAQLPDEQQNAYLLSNKAALLKRLNFQPSQLQQINNRKQSLQSHHQTPPAASVPLPGAVQGSQHFSTTGGGIVVNTDALAGAGAGGAIANGLKRPADTNPVAGSIKSKRTIWVESQIKKDQNEAVNPNYDIKFKGAEDACKRLLRYHVFYELDRSPDDMKQAEDSFEMKSASLLGKKDAMLKKYHYLLKMESMRPNASSEEVMLARLWDTHERTSLAREKEDVAAGKRLQLPPLPKTWADQFGVDEDFGQNAPQDAKEETIDEQQDEVQEAVEGEADEGKQHFGVKFSRSQSGRWGVDGPKEDPAGVDEEYDEFQSIKDEIGGYNKGGGEKTATKAFGSDDETDFNLQDVDAAEAVDNIIADMEKESRAEDEAAIEAVAAAAAAAAAEDSAINSVLQERIETPDFESLLNLDEAEEMLERDQDPVTEAAVKSITQF